MQIAFKQKTHLMNKKLENNSSLSFILSFRHLRTKGHTENLGFLKLLNVIFIMKLVKLRK